MKFLSKLADQYKSLELEKPSWVLEYDGSMAGTAVQTGIGNIASAASTAATSTASVAGKSVVDALMNAMNVIGDTPTVQKLKPAVVKAKTDVEKAVTDTTSKVLDKLNAVKADLTKAATPATTPVTSPLTSTVK